MAGSPGGIPTGVKASVAVIPDTSRFIPSLQKFIKRIEHQLKIEIPTTADVSGIADPIRRERERQQNDPVSVPFKADTDEFRRQARAAASQVQRSVEVDIPLTADGEALRRKLATEVKGLEKLLSIDVPVDLEQAAALRTKVRAEIERVQAIADRDPIVLQVRVEKQRAREAQAAAVAAVKAVQKAQAQAAKQFVRDQEKAAKAAERVRDDLANGKAEASRILTFVAALPGRLRAAAALVAPLAAAFSAAATIAPALLAAGTATIKYGRAALAAAPALLVFAAAGGIVISTLKAIGPRLGKSLSPIGTALKKVGKEAATAAAKGVRPLAKSFADAALPKVEPAIKRIGVATNGVVKDFLEWGKSTAGLKAIEAITRSTARAFEVVSPAVERFAESLANMLGRIAKVSLGKGADGLSGFLDRLSAAMKKVDAKSVADGIETLAAGARKLASGVKAAFDVVSASVDLYRRYEKQIKQAADAAALAAIVFGGPVTAGIAGVGLLVRHFGKLKGAVQGVQDAAAKNSNLGNFLRTAATLGGEFAATAGEVWTEAKQKLTPALSDLAAAIRDDLLPQLTGLMTNLGPTLVTAIRISGSSLIALLQLIIDGFTNMAHIVAGAMEVVNGALTLDPGKVTEGLSKVFAGQSKFITDAARDLGNVATAGFAAGLSSGAADAQRAAQNLAAAVKAGLAPGDLSPDGRRLARGFEKGFGGFIPSIQATAKTVPTAVKNGVTYGNGLGVLKGPGKQTGAQYASGIEQSLAGVRSSAGQLPKNAKMGAGDGSILRAPGAKSGQAFADGVTSRKGQAKSAGSSLGTAAKTGIGVITLFSPGARLGQSLADGILSKAASVAGAAQRLASSIRDKFPGSPIKEGPLVGWNNGGAGVKLVGFLAAGIEKATPVLSTSMTALARYIAGGFTKGLAGAGAAVKSAATDMINKLQDAVKSYRDKRTSLADKITADQAAVKAAQSRYAQTLKDHAKTASGAIRSAAQSLKNAQAKYAGDLAGKTSAKALDSDRRSIDSAKVRYNNAISSQSVSARKAITAARTSLAKAVAKLGKDTGLANALDLSSGNLSKLSNQQITGLRHYIQVHSRDLAKLAEVRAAVAERLKDAQGKLDEALRLRDDYAKSIADSTRAFGTLITAAPNEKKALTAVDVVKSLQAKVDAITKFRANLDRLRASGLSDAALKQLVDAGVEAGSATATALATGGQEAIAQVNNLTASISSQADVLGQQAAQQFYGAGVAAAQGLVDGLASQQALIEARMKQIADSMTKQIKKSLGIKSPSRVMASLGEYIGEGLARGIDSSRVLVERATARLSSAATPVAADFAAAGASGSVGSRTVNVTNHYPTPETSSEATTRTMRKLAILGLA